jgi:hypothetical protein
MKQHQSVQMTYYDLKSVKTLSHGLKTLATMTKGIFSLQKYKVVVVVVVVVINRIIYWFTEMSHKFSSLESIQDQKLLQNVCTCKNDSH